MNIQQLKAIFPSADEQWITAVLDVCPQWGINSPSRQSAFLGQVWHESRGLTVFEENLNYSAERLMKVWPGRFPNKEIADRYEYDPESLANYVYANRIGNGDTESGDGWFFHGRGPIQLTGRNNYTAFQESTLVQVLDNPELLLFPVEGMISSCWFWMSRDLNFYADNNDHVTITKRINGGMTGFEERMRYVNLAKEVLQ